MKNDEESEDRFDGSGICSCPSCVRDRLECLVFRPIKLKDDYCPICGENNGNPCKNCEI